MRTLIIIIVSLFYVLEASSQKDKVVLTIADDPIYKSEFEYVFRKNNSDTIITRSDLDEYMDLFINYKLKVKEAEMLGKDTARAFVKELNGYRNQLAAPYLTNDKVNQELMQEAYGRLTEEIRASHILFKVDESALPEDTLEVYIRAMEVYNDLQNGGNFVKIARLVSEDPSVKSNNGDLGYFTAFQMVYPFETAAYNTPKGEVSKPVRTRFGYHLIEIVDRRPARGEVKVAHIVILANSKQRAEEREQAKVRIFEIYEQLKAGADFAKLASQYSDDKGSAQKGGELPYFGPGKMVAEFETAAFSLDNPGDITEPFTTQYGWHVVKLIDRKELGSFEELEPMIRKKIKRDSRGKLGKQAFINQLKAEYKFKEYEKNMPLIYELVDSTIYYNTWKNNPLWQTGNPLFSFAGKKYSQFDFLEYVEDNQYQSGQKKADKLPGLDSFIKSRYDRFVDKMLFEFEKSQLESKHPEFKALMKEYHDGILLFELSDEKIWNKASTDSAGLQGYYEAHKTEHIWPRRIHGAILKSTDKEILNKASQMLQTGVKMDSIRSLLNDSSSLNLISKEGKFSEEEEPVLKSFGWKKGASEIKEINQMYTMLWVEEVLQPMPKSLNEIRGVMISGYQTYLEEQWVKELREKYSIEVKKDVLYSLED
jgi:peptidyl-prolyl cis-trans isomerase SurA